MSEDIKKEIYNKIGKYKDPTTEKYFSAENSNINIIGPPEELKEAVRELSRELVRMAVNMYFFLDRVDVPN